jgi:hypothetical protein
LALLLLSLVVVDRDDTILEEGALQLFAPHGALFLARLGTGSIDDLDPGIDLHDLLL